MKEKEFDAQIEVLYSNEHLKAHEKDFLLPIEEIILKIKNQLSEIPREQRVGFFESELFPKEKIGFVGCIKQPDLDKIFWGKRSGRKVPSRLVKEKINEFQFGLVVIGRWKSPDEFRLITTFPGQISPKEITDKSLKKEEFNQSFEFWKNNALIIMEGDEIYSKSEEMEKAFQSGNINLLKELAHEENK